MQSEPKNPNQLDLELPGAEFAEKLAVETSDVARLSAEVVEKGLVRELRPVFIYDKKLAKEKQGNAARQDKFRAEREKQGLKTGLAPIEVLEKVKALGGGADGWIKFLAQAGNVKEDSSVTGNGVSAVIQRIEVPVEVIKEVIIEKIVEKEVVKEVPVEVFIEKIVVKEVPGETVYKEKIVEKQVLRLNSEGRKMLKIGEKVAALTGWRLKIVQFLAGI